MANSSFANGPSGAKPKPFITWERFVVYTVLIVCALFFLFPLYIMIITSLVPAPISLSLLSLIMRSTGNSLE